MATKTDFFDKNIPQTEGLKTPSLKLPSAILSSHQSSVISHYTHSLKTVATI
jgi:hypothetical protein